MPDPLSIISQPIDETSFGLNFYWNGDRFEHTVFAQTHGASQDIVLLTSSEGNDSEEWPPSPPLQDFHLQEIGTSKVAMAVGMAGSSHWSAACSLHQSTAEVRFHFDMACRADGTPNWLGSTYQCSSELQFNDAPTRARLIRLPKFELEIQALEVDGLCTRLEATEKQIQMSLPVHEFVSPASQSLKSPSQTFRWQYEFAVRQFP